MSSFIRNRVTAIKSDWIQWLTCLTAALLLVCHIWQFYDSGYMFQPLTRIILYPVLIIAVFLIGRKAILYVFLVFAYVSTLDITFENYTSFIVVCIFCFIKGKEPVRQNKKFYIIHLSIYALCALVSCQRHDKDASHIVIHFVNCIWIYITIFFFIKKGRSKRHLVLDDIQKRILKELSEGKMQKEIDFVNKNTITNKLHDALIENNLMTKEQLLMRYIEEYVEN